MLSLAAPSGFFTIADRVVGRARWASSVVGLASSDSGTWGVGRSVRGMGATTGTW